MRSGLSVVGILAVICGLSACAVDKSSNPLSPSVAGPIPGVAITAPDIVQPAPGARISIEQQPITLTLQNSSTSGVRPLSYHFEVAADPSFANVLASQSAVEPGESGRTSFRLPDALASGRTYYWRARAEDGANTGPYSGVAAFNVFTPVVIAQPVLASPVGNAVIDTLQPKFVITNAPRSGPAGSISYLIELSNADSFGSVLAAWVFDEQPNQSTLLAPVGLTASTTYFWRARAFDASTVGPFSAVATFRTAAPAAPPPPPSSPGGGSGGPSCSGAAASDGINMASAGIYNSPLDLASWCIGAKITSVQFTNNAFLVDFDRRDGPNRWPDYVTPGWAGPLQYTLGMCLNVNGQWACSAVVEFWHGRSLGDSAPPWAIARDWFYDSRWGPLAGRQPADGEQVGIFVCAGDCRNTTVAINPNFKQRSNVAMVRWSNSGGPLFTF
jgi:hypothetical protein